MPKMKKKIDNKQISIFDYLRELSKQQEPTEGKFRIIDELRTSLRQAIKQSPLSRHQIAGQMSHLLDESITKEMIDSWTRQSDEINGRPGRHIPAEYLPAFCEVTGSNETLIVMGKRVGLFILPGCEALRAEIQTLDEQIKKTQSKKKQRLLLLKELKKVGE
jgi:hypothetical protein